MQNVFDRKGRGFFKGARAGDGCDHVRKGMRRRVKGRVKCGRKVKWDGKK